MMRKMSILSSQIYLVMNQEHKVYISNSFSNYFVNVGKKLADEIPDVRNSSIFGHLGHFITLLCSYNIQINVKY